MNSFCQLPFRKLKKFLLPAIISLAILLVYLLIPIENEKYEKIFQKNITIQASSAHKTTHVHNFVFNPNGSNIILNYNVHIFYYAWYGNLNVDKKWIHWNHKRLAHWNNPLVNDYSQDGHNPPDDIGADFYPALGLYSSKNLTIIQEHFKMIRYTGIGVIVLSWYAKDRSDPNGEPVDNLVGIILNEAEKFQLKVALHMEPYPGRSIISIKEDLHYIFKNYASHSAYFKKPRFNSDRPLPVVFIYDSYLIPSRDWSQILGRRLNLTIRNTAGDMFVVGLLLDRDSCAELSESGFDAGYTYFSGEQVSYSSNSKHWTDLNRKCSLRHLDFYPSVGPGYKDASIRPWNEFVTQDRESGRFFSRKFQKVLESGARSFGITSFNEWHEGTQIEPALPHSHSPERLFYEDYSPKSPIFYLEMARKFVQRFSSHTGIPLESEND